MNGRLANLKSLAQDAASKVDVLERFERASGFFQRFGNRTSLARRQAVAACGSAALGVGLGVVLSTSFLQGLALSPLLGICLGCLGRLLVPRTSGEKRDDEARRLLNYYDEAAARGLLEAASQIEGHFARVATSEVAELLLFTETSRKQVSRRVVKTLPSTQFNVIDEEVVPHEGKVQGARVTS